MNYQWKTKAFQLTGLPEKKGLERSSTTMSQDSFSVDSVGTVQEILSGWNPLNNPYPNETPAEKLRREAREADERYKQAVKKLDSLRCNLEEAMVDHLKFMERCELDRLKAIKAVILDFSGAISNVIPSLQSTVDKMMLFQETIQPLGDVRYLLENYRTGPFLPKVTTYENYYNSVDGRRAALFV
jgi:DNA repair ATPase RecN